VLLQFENKYYVHVYVSICQIEIPYEIPYALVNVVSFYQKFHMKLKYMDINLAKN
jgi:hypothetical protein